MHYINVPVSNCDKEYERCVVYNCNDFPYYKYLLPKTVAKPGRKKRVIEYINLPCAFDIETTTLEKVKTTKTSELYGEGYMYHWQFCVCDRVCFGRTWEEFIIFCRKLREVMGCSKNKLLPVYVHNLSFEFQFMKDFVHIDSLFAREKRKVMKFVGDFFEYRCSYFLSNMSLAKFCENTQNVTFYKMVDEYDYRKLRTPATPMTEKEEGYCYCDVRGLSQCIAELMKEDNLAQIPLTNTGYVRRVYRNAMATKKLRDNFHKLALLPHQYEMCVKAFCGGISHANRYYANKIINNVYSMDISSSYPTVILEEYFPMGKFTDVTLDSKEKYDYYTKNFCVVMHISIFDIEIKDNMAIPYISVSKCVKSRQIKNDNGKLLSAKYIELYLTEIDMEIIQKEYDIKGGFVVDRAMYAERGKLPLELRKMCMYYFYQKTLLKGIESKEYEYMKSKNRLNSTFGMMVTSLINPEIIFCDGKWKEEKPNTKKALDRYYKSENSFLHYQWGIYVTAHARKRLMKGVFEIGKDVVYVDTDSIKYINNHDDDFKKFNQELIKKATENDIPAFVDRGNKRYYLGIWDADGVYIRFKTLGAKKYCCNKINKDGLIKFEVTVAGMNKKKGSEAVKTCANFRIGQVFENVGRTTSWFNESKPHSITVEGCTFTTASNIGILDNTYTLGVTNEYWEILGEYGLVS